MNGVENITTNCRYIFSYYFVILPVIRSTALNLIRALDKSVLLHKFIYRPASVPYIILVI